MSTALLPWLRSAPPLEDVPLHGQDWNAVQVIREVDGDTVRLLRARVTAEMVDSDDLGGLLCEDWRVRVVRDDEEEFPGGLAGRLTTLDTPERGQSGYKEATADLTHWLLLHADELRCVTYATGGGFDRLLVDLYVLEPDGSRSTASEWMLAQGWLPYVEGQ